MSNVVTSTVATRRCDDAAPATVVYTRRRIFWLKTRKAFTGWQL